MIVARGLGRGAVAGALVAFGLGLSQLPDVTPPGIGKTPNRRQDTAARRVEIPAARAENNAVAVRAGNDKTASAVRVASQAGERAGSSTESTRSNGGNESARRANSTQARRAPTGAARRRT